MQTISCFVSAATLLLVSCVASAQTGGWFQEDSLPPPSPIPPEAVEALDSALAVGKFEKRLGRNLWDHVLDALRDRIERAVVEEREALALQALAVVPHSQRNLADRMLQLMPRVIPATNDVQARVQEKVSRCELGESAVLFLIVQNRVDVADGLINALFSCAVSAPRAVQLSEGGLVSLQAVFGAVRLAAVLATIAPPSDRVGFLAYLEIDNYSSGAQRVEYLQRSLADGTACTGDLFEIFRQAPVAQLSSLLDAARARGLDEDCITEILEARSSEEPDDAFDPRFD